MTDYERRALERAIEARLAALKARGVDRRTPRFDMGGAFVDHEDYRDLATVLDRLRRGEAL